MRRSKFIVIYFDVRNVYPQATHTHNKAYLLFPCYDASFISDILSPHSPASFIFLPPLPRFSQALPIQPPPRFYQRLFSAFLDLAQGHRPPVFTNTPPDLTSTWHSVRKPRRRQEHDESDDEREKERRTGVESSNISR